MTTTLVSPPQKEAPYDWELNDSELGRAFTVWPSDVVAGLGYSAFDVTHPVVDSGRSSMGCFPIIFENPDGEALTPLPNRWIDGPIGVLSVLQRPNSLTITRVARDLDLRIRYPSPFLTVSPATPDTAIADDLPQQNMPVAGLGEALGNLGDIVNRYRPPEGYIGKAAMAAALGTGSILALPQPTAIELTAHHAIEALPAAGLTEVIGVQTAAIPRELAETAAPPLRYDVLDGGSPPSTTELVQLTSTEVDVAVAEKPEQVNITKKPEQTEVIVQTPDITKLLDSLPATVTQWYPELWDVACNSKVSSEYIPLMLVMVKMETGGDPNARSEVGAEGLAQIMPHMKDVLIERFGFPASTDSFEPTDNLKMQSFLVNDIAGRIKRGPLKDAPLQVRLAYILAGYNGGTRAEKQIVRHWNGLTDEQRMHYLDNLPHLTYANGTANTQTTNYVKNGLSGYMHLYDAD